MVELVNEIYSLNNSIEKDFCCLRTQCILKKDAYILQDTTKHEQNLDFILIILHNGYTLN